MPHNIICPICNQPGRQLEGITRDSHVDYFRCDPCWHVWLLDSKFEPDGPCDRRIHNQLCNRRKTPNDRPDTITPPL